ncbi:type II toxin-antitoxin system RelE/ParE family toxin [Rhizobium wuzhouense]|uniref:Plasmid stabilization protein n=1 Tax=Rhizobium wuzhouense TaxID=1986026 RepID=A0ABX5NXM5_9HYPH|nr:type II toxin-antitoxin system RelE/ParE family toxin [Rhizobium wuzhouense]PYB77074.1 plasmid stabilization protein [Rhizobium wuzhouense]
MSYQIKYTQDVLDDLDRLYTYLVQYDLALAERAYVAVQLAISSLERLPLIHRMAKGGDPMMREMVVAFGTTGYVVLYRIVSDDLLTVAAIRHQREDDYR